MDRKVKWWDRIVDRIAKTFRVEGWPKIALLFQYSHPPNPQRPPIRHIFPPATEHKARTFNHGDITEHQPRSTSHTVRTPAMELRARKISDGAPATEHQSQSVLSRSTSHRAPTGETPAAPAKEHQPWSPNTTHQTRSTSHGAPVTKPQHHHTHTARATGVGK